MKQSWHPGDEIDYYINSWSSRRTGVIQYRSLVNDAEIEYVVKTRMGKFEVVKQSAIVSGNRLLNDSLKCECGSESPDDAHAHSWYCPRRVKGIMA